MILSPDLGRPAVGTRVCISYPVSGIKNCTGVIVDGVPPRDRGHVYIHVDQLDKTLAFYNHEYWRTL